MSGRYIELDVLQSHTADLNQAIAAAPTNPVLVGQQLVQHGFSVQATVNGIVNTLGFTDYHKGSQLLNLVDSKIRTTGTRENARKYFNDFLLIIANDMGQRDIAESLVTTFKSKDPTYTPPPLKDQVSPPPPITPVATGGGCRFNDRDYAEIYQKLCSHAHEWREIGRGLGFSTNEMDIIASNPMLLLRGPNGYLEKLLSQWLQWAPGDGRGSKGFATRESLIAGLLKVNLGGLAENFGYTQPPPREPEPRTATEPRPASEPKPDTVRCSHIKLIKWKDDKGEVQRFYLMDKISHKWQDIGELLDLSHVELENISMKCLKDPKECCRAVLGQWLDNPPEGYPTTWAGLIELLHDSQLGQVASQVKDIEDKATCIL